MEIAEADAEIVPVDRVDDRGAVTPLGNLKLIVGTRSGPACRRPMTRTSFREPR